MHKIAVAILLTLALCTFASAPALAASGPAVTTNQHEHGTWVETDLNPVTGNWVEATFDGNTFEHVTYFPGTDQGISAFGETGTISFVDNGVAYFGRATAGFAGKFIQRNSVETFTLNVRVMGSDGTSVWIHQTTHITYNGNGVMTVTFDKLRFG